MLSQSEADALIAMRKTFVGSSAVSVPPGSDHTHELVGDDPAERFLLDIWRGTIRLLKLRFQTRARKVVVLVRLDIDGAPHTNPDGTRLGGTHLHLYREGYEDRWAFSVDPNEFADMADVRLAFDYFCRYCRIEGVPPFQAELI
jgi:hypothetical protein